jgi:hypothetical protein
MGLDLVWEEPPPSIGNRGRAAEIDRAVAELKKHPGQWARVEEAKQTSAATKWQKRGCETAVRRPDSKKNDVLVYARWPEPKTPDPKELAKKATPEQLAEAYAKKHGAAVAGVPRQQHLTEEQQVDQAWRDRLGGKKAPR